MNQRDLELLSTYLDGQLNPSQSAQLETRLKSDPQLASALTDLRFTRNLLRKLPSRKAPRNFTLTRKMVGQNPPLPRVFPVFRFATALATLLFVFSFGLNSFGRLAASQVPMYGMGGGGGGSSEDTTIEQPYADESSLATEIPASEAPALAPPAPFAAISTQVLTPEVESGVRIADTPASKAGDAANAVGQPDQFQVENEAPSPVPLVPSTWQIVLAVIAIGSALLMILIRQISARRWK